MCNIFIAKVSDGTSVNFIDKLFKFNSLLFSKLVMLVARLKKIADLHGWNSTSAYLCVSSGTKTVVMYHTIN